jgi:DNA-binding NarL/FixJ family response regulator
MGVKLLVINDQEVMLAGLRVVVATSEIEVIKEVSVEGNHIELISTLKPNVCLIDVGFAPTRGFSILEELHDSWPDLPMLMWSCNDNPTYVARANALGARGFLLHSASGSDTIAAILAVSAGKTAWSVAHHNGVIQPRELPEQLPASLTPREIDVLRQLAFGLSNREIGKVLAISYETVKEHVQHILSKLNMADRTQAAVWAVRNGLG